MPKKILVIEDDPDIRTYLVSFFKDSGYETHFADDGDVGYDKLTEINPDLITLDLQMPKETGTRFYRKLAKNKDYKDTPVIIISGLPGRHLAVKNPVAIFDKPIDKEEVLKVIRETIGE